ncbi:MAG TPA: 2'-5' RNA ligase family protein, partial [Ornithinibacter sp.]|nr:2'-5' RNA ligase family protein [Ornithinibacter sp.]
MLAHADAALAPVRAANPDLRWVPPERWHLTLAFYGEVP